VEQKLLTVPEHLSSTPVFSRVHVTRSLVLYVMFCRSLFVFLSFFFWPLCCLFFFDLRILIIKRGILLTHVYSLIPIVVVWKKCIMVNT